MPLLKKGTKTLEREALKTGLNIAGDVVQGINIKQAAKSRLKSTEENLLQKAMDTVGPPASLISSSRKYRIFFTCLVYVIIVVSFRIVTMSWFHSRENSFRFLQ
jgi:hypothetical protein